MSAPDRYDHVPYPSHTFPQTHPDRLATAALIAGLTAAPPTHCRYLEIGCGTGTNLIAMASNLPESTFLGIDLAAAPISSAVAMATELGLSNIEFRRGDICDLDLVVGRFDYIVAHGVYSWVPSSVRDAMMRLCQQHLEPQGVGYISYNAYPGCHVRDMVRRMMIYHTRDIDEAVPKIEQGRALIQFLATAGAGPELYGPLLNKELPHLQNDDIGLIYHDEFSPINEPSYFHEFVAHAAGFQLQFLSEAIIHEMQDKAYTPEVVAILRQLDDDIVRKEQYLDFLKCRRFRQSLLCHAAVTLERAGGLRRAIPHLRFASDAVAEQPANVASSTAAEPMVVTFRRTNQSTVGTKTPLARHTIEHLSAVWPLTCSWDDLRTHLQNALGREAVDEGELMQVLQDTVTIGLVDARLTEVPCVVQPGSTPRVSAWTRAQAERGTVVSTQRHHSVRLDDGMIRRLLQLLDGSRDQAALVEVLVADLVSGRLAKPKGLTSEDPEAIHRAVAAELPKLLARAGRLALLIA